MNVPLFPSSAPRSVAPEELKSLGDRAASSWVNGEHCSLTCAVTDTIKNASAALNTEHVKRVVEFANVGAYLLEFNKEGTAHKYVDFGPEGPADPGEVLKELNHCGGKMPSDLSDYSGPPERVKESSADMVLDQAFGVANRKPSADIPEHNPLGEVMDLRDKLAGMYDHLTAQLSGLETIYSDLSEHLYGHVKQACKQGATLGEVLSAWSTVSTDPVFVKAAFDQMSPRLITDGAMSSLSEIGDSLEKTGGARYVRQDHPAVTTYEEFCDALHKLAQVREARDQVEDGYSQLTAFIVKSAGMKKEAVGGVLGSVAKKYRENVVPALEEFSEKAVDSKWPGKLVGYGVPAALIYGGGKYMHDAMRDAAVGSGIASHIPIESNPYYQQTRMQRRGGYR